MELAFKEFPHKEQTLSFTIREKAITGLTGNHLDDLLGIIRLQGKRKNHIEINQEELKEKDFYNIKRKISFIPEFIEENIHEETIAEVMIEHIRRNAAYPKNLVKKLEGAIKIVGLDESYLQRNIYTCSTSEKKLIQIALELLINPEILILEEPFKTLDTKNRKKIRLVLRRIKEQYGKAIIILSSNPNVLLQETDCMIAYKNYKILAEEPTIEFYQKVDVLKKHKIAIPDIIEFTYLAKKKKNAKIDYAKDIRDLIKDIYKHV